MSNPFTEKAKSPSGGGSSKKVKIPARSASSKSKKKMIRPMTRSSDGSSSTSGTKRQNPWSSKITHSDSSMSSGQTNAGTRRTRSGISTALSSSGPRSRLKEQSGYTLTPVPTGPDVSGVSVGDKVRITWAVDPAYGMAGHGTFAGKVTALNDWITIVDTKRVKFHYPVSTLSGCEVLGVDRQRRIKRRG